MKYIYGYPWNGHPYRSGLTLSNSLRDAPRSLSNLYRSFTGRTGGLPSPPLPIRIFYCQTFYFSSERAVWEGSSGFSKRGWGVNSRPPLVYFLGGGLPYLPTGIYFCEALRSKDLATFALRTYRDRWRGWRPEPCQTRRPSNSTRSDEGDSATYRAGIQIPFPKRLSLPEL